MLMAMFACLTFTACEDDPEIADAGPVDKPQETSAGVYAGTWTRTVGNNTETAEGTFTLEASASYVSAYKMECPGLKFVVDVKNELKPDGTEDPNKQYAIEESEATGRVNIQRVQDGYFFFNDTKFSGLNIPIRGTISSENMLEFSYSNTVKNGRKTTIYKFSFIGTKQ